MTGGPRVLDEMPTRRDETHSFVLSVRTLAGLHGQHNARENLCQGRGHCLQGSRKQDKVCDGAFIKKERQLIDENRTHAPSGNAAEKLRDLQPKSFSNHVERAGW